MRVLISGGEKTINIIKAVNSKFIASGDDFLEVKYIDDILSIFSMGDYFDKALISEQSITRDGAITNEIELRNRVNTFANQISEKQNRFNFVFLASNKEMAQIIYDEILPIISCSSVVLSAPPYKTTFFIDLIIKESHDIQKEWRFEPEIEKASTYMIEEENSNYNDILDDFGYDLDNSFNTLPEDDNFDSLDGWDTEDNNELNFEDEINNQDNFDDNNYNNEINFENEFNSQEIIYNNENNNIDLDKQEQNFDNDNKDNFSSGLSLDKEEFNDNNYAQDNFSSGLSLDKEEFNDNNYAQDNNLYEQQNEFDDTIYNEQNNLDNYIEQENEFDDTVYNEQPNLNNYQEHNENFNDNVYNEQNNFNNQQVQQNSVDKNNKIKKGFGIFRKQKNNQQINYVNINNTTGKVNVNGIKEALKPFALRGNSILVTGCGGCGTSFIAYNIANIINQLGYTVLLVDMDTEGKSQSYITKSNFDSMNVDDANLISAVNSSNSISNYVSIVKQGFHLLTMGMGTDTAPLKDLIHKEKLSRFVNITKSSYNFIIYDTKFSDATSFLEDITYTVDNLILVADTSNWGLTKMMLNVCNIVSEDMQDAFFSRAQLVLNRFRNLNKLLGKKVRTGMDIVKVIDSKVEEILGEDPGFYFRDMQLSGIINDDPNIESTWNSEESFTDSHKGQEIFLNLIEFIMLKK